MEPVKGKLSVVIPTYNGSKYLEQTLQSVAGQSYGDIEIIVVNDGSTDGTGLILDRYRANEKFVIVDQENKGPGAARNKGIGLARGEFIAILDHDDVWLGDLVEKEMGLLKADSRIGAVFCDGFYEGTEERMRAKFKVPRNMDYHRMVLNGFVILFSSCIFRRSAVEETGLLDERLTVGDDTDYYVRFTRNYKLGYIDEKLYVKRFHATNTFRVSPRRCAYALLVYKKNKKYYEEAGMLKAYGKGAGDIYNLARKNMSSLRFIRGLECLYCSMQLNFLYAFKLPPLVIRYFRFLLKKHTKVERDAI